MKVLVAGASGAIGRRLVPQLVARGHEVVGTARSEEKLAAVRELGAEAVRMDGLDARQVQEVVAAAQLDAIVHQMTALAGGTDLKRFDETFAATNRLRVEGTRNLLATGVERLVVQSFTGWPNARTGGPVKTEDDPLDDDPVPSQRRTLAAIRELEQLCADHTVLRYGNLYGGGASDELVALVRRRAIPVVGGGAGVWSWIHVEDAASATVAALEQSAAGIYNVVDDDPAPVAEWLPALAAAAGAKPPRRVPAWLARPLAGEAAVRWMTEGRGASNAKARRDLGWTPRWASWRDGFREALFA
jgi:nucleoside-diphosphate-sugar epimerase